MILSFLNEPKVISDMHLVINLFKYVNNNGQPVIKVVSLIYCIGGI